MNWSIWEELTPWQYHFLTHFFNSSLTNVIVFSTKDLNIFFVVRFIPGFFYTIVNCIHLKISFFIHLLLEYRNTILCIYLYPGPLIHPIINFNSFSVESFGLTTCTIMSMNNDRCLPFSTSIFISIWLWLGHPIQSNVV